jgi:hypothetical protein
LTSRPHIRRAVVKSRDKVALQTFRTAKATLTTPVEPLIGMSCMMAATIARGPAGGTVSNANGT